VTTSGLVLPPSPTDRVHHLQPLTGQPRSKRISLSRANATSQGEDNMPRVAGRWLILLAVSLMAAGCSPFGLTVRADPPTPVGTVDGIHLTGLGTAKNVSEVLWSPSGQHFALATSQPGTFILGTTHPLRVETVVFPTVRSIVALTNTSAIVASSEATQDWIYPLHGLTLGSPIPWTAPTDTWQEWVDTGAGPAIVTGGYRPGTVALEWASGRRFLLHGNQVYPSADGYYGAVTAGHRLHRVVSPVGDVQVPAEWQPANPEKPITIWDFRGRTPRQLYTLHLPPVPGPEGIIDTITFSPNDRYVAISTMSFDSPLKTTPGHTFVYSVRTGRLLGTGPWGNGTQWASNSRAIWLGTAAAEGHGDDHIMTPDGTMVQSWPDSVSNTVVGMVNAHTLIMEEGAVTAPTQWLAVWNPRTGREIKVASDTNAPLSVSWSPSPSGSAAVLTVGDKVLYANWSALRSSGSVG